ncbi:hypothetical protein BOTBODRAFT_58448 [Botryobasidium botryosum FD-172 SS1]|uniref:ATP-dependent DNA helicase CHL1 n=1 Tax=Botryobasidium botryosum (strain FD-172 SS1) TaxID=930990 RepID=A0A067M5F6_BOTB1|nr:hypothetical protein BOTBODRAFT_58448 [Botryobasidium botryosum FD-172 SS1]
MSSSDLSLKTPDEFPTFPYSPPYAIQLDLMRHLYAAIESRKVTIIESPTGTGKTLSLLCGAMTWLMDEKQRAKKGQLDAFQESLKGDNDPDWVVEQSLASFRREMEAVETEFEERLAKARKKEEQMRKMEKARVTKRQKTAHEKQELDDEDDDYFLPDEDEMEDNISPEVRELMKHRKPHRRPNDDKDEEPTCTKIYYASRTHTQLSQTLTELRKTSYASHIRCVPLGSRKNLCINEDVRKKGGDLDEACRELMSEKKGKRCPYMPPADEETQMLDFRDHTLAEPRDIEDLVVLGKNLKTCPYYGSRKAIKQAELVTLPYNLLHKNAREALGIDLTDQIVVIDEAHNIIDTILSYHTLPLSSNTLQTSLTQLTIYLTRFRARLNSQHSLHLRRLVGFLGAISKYCASWLEQGKKDEMMNPAQFVGGLGAKVEGVNLLEVVKYLRESKIARKISGYSDKMAEKAAAKDPSKASTYSSRRGVTPPLHAVEAFLVALTNPDEDGRIFLSRTGNLAEGKDKETVGLKYQLLNPGPQFQDVVEQARAVVLAGGTMSPISEFRSQLFGTVPADRFSTFACGHVIPPSHLQTLVMSRGPRGGEVQFKFASRGDKEVLGELGQTLFNLANLIPDGMVVFFPSYAFLGQVKKLWQETGLLTKLGAKKAVFFEPQESGDVEKVLRDYAAAIKTKPADAAQAAKRRGAILLAVVGAKLSEGLNFTDDLARAVVIVGLPFANLGSVELKERMNYVTALEKQQGGPARGTKDAGTELYENLCMKVCRAIRHQNDWASLILLDSRYASARIRGKLPGWIGKNVLVAQTFGEAVKELGAFYRNKRSNGVA